MNDPDNGWVPANRFGVKVIVSLCRQRRYGIVKTCSRKAAARGRR